MGEIRNILLGLLAFSAVITGLSVYYADVSSSSGASTHTSNLTQLSQLNSIQNATYDVEQSLKGQQITGTFLDFPLTVVSGIYNVLKLLLGGVVNIFEVFLDSVILYLHLPAWVKGLAMLAVAITVMFAIMSAALRWDI
jgi:hypothetical protein